MSTSARSVPIDPASGREIENLIARYAELVDDGDFTGVGNLLADATYRGSGAPLGGREAIEKWFRDTLIVYPDGTPRTQHVTTNIAIELDEQAADTALARSYVTVLQALPGLPPEPIAAGRYRDRFQRHDGTWRFTERRVDIRLVGDLSGHLRQTAEQG
jgi:3-phenylpropionate/cinnamic acid dioxygenase small subunit